MALAANSNVRTRGGSSRGVEQAQAEDAVVFYAGGLVGVDLADGLIKKWDDVATYRLMGLVLEGVTGDTSASPPVEIRMNTSGPVIERVSVTGAASQGDNGELVYATDDNTYTLTPTANVNAVGRVARYHSGTTCDVKLFTPDEYRGL